MTDNVNWMLTDEFVAFSEKIKEIHEQKKSKKLELKAFYDKIQVDMKELDDQASKLNSEFETFKASLDQK